MKRIRRILVPIDFSESAEHAVAHGVDLARRVGAAVHVLHVSAYYEPELYGEVGDLPETETVREHLQQIAERRLEETVATLDAADVEVTRALRQSFSIPSSILSYAEAHAIDLIVMGTHGRRGVRHLLLGSVAEEVVKKATVDVLTVRAPDAGGAAAPVVRRILVPLDFSAYSAPSLRAAADVARTYDAQLDLLHVSEPASLPVFWIGEGTVHDIMPEYERRAREQMEVLREAAGVPAEAARIQVVRGHAPAAIVDHAGQQEVDLIVMAPRGHTAFERFFIGSVTERVLRTAACPVLVLHGLVPDHEERVPAELSRIEAEPSPGTPSY